MATALAYLQVSLNLLLELPLCFNFSLIQHHPSLKRLGAIFWPWILYMDVLISGEGRMPGAMTYAAKHTAVLVHPCTPRHKIIRDQNVRERLCKCVEYFSDTSGRDNRLLALRSLSSVRLYRFHRVAGLT